MRLSQDVEGMRSFKATVIHFSNDGEVVSLGLADSRENVKDHILLQRTLHPNGQDIALGMDGIHTTVIDQIRSCFGGIKSIRVSAETIVFEFDENASKALRVSDCFTVDISCEHTAEVLLDMFSAVCGDRVFLSVKPT